jgi:hypothetical protein
LKTAWGGDISRGFESYALARKSLP